MPRAINNVCVFFTVFIDTPFTISDIAEEQTKKGSSPSTVRCFTGKGLI
jgi:hypothetical protein